MIVVEIICEKLILWFYQELFYQLIVEIESWEECKDGLVKIDQVVYVSCDGYKGIIFGCKGEIVKVVFKVVCEELQEFFGCCVYLFFQVKVCLNWLEDFEWYFEMGLDFKDGN